MAGLYPAAGLWRRRGGRKAPQGALYFDGHFEGVDTVYPGRWRNIRSGMKQKLFLSVKCNLTLLAESTNCRSEKEVLDCLFSLSLSNTDGDVFQII